MLITTEYLHGHFGCTELMLSCIKLARCTELMLCTELVLCTELMLSCIKLPRCTELLLSITEPYYIHTSKHSRRISSNTSYWSQLD